jgi:hypothetical protein
MLPTKKTMAVTDISKYTMLIYGVPKIGKSTFCSQLDSPLFIATEPGLNALDTFQVDCSSWKQFKKACVELQKGDHDFKTVIIDTVDNLFMQCSEYICKEKGVSHESDLPMGKGYSLVTDEFKRVLTKLAALPYGVILISHAQQITVETRTGDFTKTTTTLGGKQKKFVNGFVDMILYFDIAIKTIDGEEQETRIIRTKPSKFLDAGDRTGKLPDALKMDVDVFTQALTRTVKKQTASVRATETKAEAKAEMKTENKEEKKDNKETEKQTEKQAEKK